jgi:hypothetical protein
MVMPLCFGALASVRTVASPRLHSWAVLVQTFWPVDRVAVRGGDREVSAVREDQVIRPRSAKYPFDPAARRPVGYLEPVRRPVRDNRRARRGRGQQLAPQVVASRGRDRRRADRCREERAGSDDGA